MSKKIKVELVKSIKKKDPYSHKKILESHIKADKSEKKEYPKGYQKAKKMDNKLHKNQYAGENFVKSNTIKISKKVPKSLRKEVIYHEKVELTNRKKRK